MANLLDHDDGKSFLTAYNALEPQGYTLRYQLMDSLEYGNVPQKRVRIFIVAFQDENACARFSFPEKIELKTKLNDILVRGEKHDQCYYSLALNHSQNLFALVSKLVSTAGVKSILAYFRHYKNKEKSLGIIEIPRLS